MNKPLDRQELQTLKRRQSRKPNARIEPLAVLPVFWKLEDQAVLVVGATDAAAWKAELLAAAGGNVTVVGQEPSETMIALAQSQLQNGSICLEVRQWSTEDLAGKALLVADVEDPGQIEELKRASTSNAVPFNFIDQPAHCQFQFGSIVNRSPVVIGISTNGAAPILGQNIRRRIEAVVPTAMKNWAQFASAIRGGVNKHLKPGSQRRIFWEELSQRAFTTELSPEYRKSTRQRLSSIQQESIGVSSEPKTIWLSSNDPEDLTLRQVRLLQSAKSIAFGPNVSSKIQEMSRREASRLELRQGMKVGADLIVKRKQNTCT